MNSIGIVALLVALPTSSVASVIPVVPVATVDGPGERAKERLSAFRERATLPSVSAAVAIDGEVVFAAAVGYADVEGEVLATTASRYRIGSVSKTLTAGLIGRLLDQGKLDLDRPVTEVLPDYPKKRWPFTPRQLGGHIAGVRHYAGGEYLWRVHYDHVRDGLEMFEEDPLLFEPGTKYQYSSHGFNLLSAVLEVAGEDAYLTLMQREVFDPLELTGVIADHADREIPDRVKFYEVVDGASRESPVVDLSHKWAGGGFLGTPTDLARFGSAFLHDRYVSAPIRDMLITSQKTSDGRDTGYGIGWQVRSTTPGARVFGHSGGSVGGRTDLVVRPDTGVVVAVTANASQADRLQSLAAKLANLFEAQLATEESEDR